MARAGIRFDIGVRHIRREIDALEDRVHQRIEQVMEYHALEGTAYAKENAPWTDRTSNARNGLHAYTDGDKSTGQYKITFSHTVPYGIWLEIANSGRYEIIMPTVRHEGDLLMQRLDGLLGQL